MKTFLKFYNEGSEESPPTIPQNYSTLEDALEILGLSETDILDIGKVKSKYRTLSKEYHPDVSVYAREDAEELFKALQWAFQKINSTVLSGNVGTATTRERYKRDIHGWKNDPIFKSFYDSFKNYDFSANITAIRKDDAEETENTRRIKEMIQMIEDGTGGRYDHYIGTSRVYSINLRDGLISYVNPATSRGKYAHLDDILQELPEILEIAKSRDWRDIISTLKNKVYLSESRLQAFRKKRIESMKRLLDKEKHMNVVRQKAQQTFDSSVPAVNILDATFDVENMKIIIGLMSTMNILKKPTRGRRKGLIVIDGNTIDGLEHSDRPEILFIATIAEQMRKYLDSSLSLYAGPRMAWDPNYRASEIAKLIIEEDSPEFEEMAKKIRRNIIEYAHRISQIMIASGKSDVGKHASTAIRFGNTKISGDYSKIFDDI